MKQLIHFVRTQYKIMGASLVGVLAGAAITGFAVVHAAIPDSNGTIHGCRNSTTTLLRVIDTASQSCDGNETGLNWDQDGVKGYARITWGSSGAVLDSARSKNISNLYSVAVGEEDTVYYVCLTLSSTPKSISLTGQNNGTETLVGAFKDASGWTQSVIGTKCDDNGSGANVGIFITNAASHDFFATLF